MSIARNDPYESLQVNLKDLFLEVANMSETRIPARNILRQK